MQYKKKKLKLNFIVKNNIFDKYIDIIKYNGYKYEDSFGNISNIFEFFEKIINHQDIDSIKLKEKCKETLNKFYKNKKFIKEVEFLKDYPEFLPFYCNNIELKIFESINLALLAFILAYKIKIISIYKTNRVFFYNELNPKKLKEISVFIIHKHGVNYFGRFLSQNELYKINFDYKCLFNLKNVYLDYNSENYKEDCSKFTKIIIKNLIFFPHIIEIIELFNDKKNILNSAQKELKNVFSKYKKSVNKNSYSNKKAFNFKENINTDNLDPCTKSEILYGNLAPDYYTMFKPPGLKIYVFKKANKYKEKFSEKVEKEKFDINNIDKIKNIIENTGFIYKYYKEKKYGFIKANNIDEDIFFRLENIDKEISIKSLENIKFSKIEVNFIIHNYTLKDNQMKKAINIKLKK